MPTELMLAERDQNPLTTAQAGQVMTRVIDDCERAGRLLGTALPVIPVKFNLSGTAAGMFCARGKQLWLRFNPWLFAQDFDIHLNDTVTHEVAHYGIHCAFPTRRRIKPHGAEWRGLMRALGANPQATFSSDMTGLRVRRQRRFSYTCDCQQHEVSATRHYRILRQRAAYCCRFCHAELCQSARS